MPASEFRFNIFEEKFGAHSSFKLLDSHTGEYAIILPFLGGAVNRLVLSNKNDLIDVIDGYNSIDDINDNLGSSFKSSNLFPYPNRIADATYHFEGEVYHLPMNFPQENNAIHGLVFDKEFEVMQQENGELGCTLALRLISEDQIGGYPFKYLLEQTYRWNEIRGFECNIKISNLSDSSIPFGHGWHPYFKAGSKSINTLSLQFPANEVLEVDERNIPTGKSMEYQTFNNLKEIGDTQLDNCFRLDTSGDAADIIISNEQTGLKYKIWQETGVNKYNFLQLYTPPLRQSIAIEPMTCAPNAFNNEDGLIVLAPGERISVSWGVSKLI
jgi:aldose 1-epimerase